MYAVVFDLDTNCLNECYEGETYHEAYRKVRDFMSENGFSWTQGSVYFGMNGRCGKMRVGHSENGTNLPLVSNLRSGHPHAPNRRKQRFAPGNQILAHLPHYGSRRSFSLENERLLCFVSFCSSARCAPVCAAVRVGGLKA